MTVERRREFHLHERLGQGGFGEVYRATMSSPGGLRAETAVKILHNPSADALWRLRNEGKLLTQLRHPAILRAFDLATFGDRTALVTEFVDGLDLGDAFVLGMPPRAVVEAIGVVAEALHAAWSTVPAEGSEPLHLVHRDIKPSNLRLGHHGDVKVLDFGIAFASDEGQRDGDTRGTTMIGSLAYMAPERFARAVAHPSGDVYALGCTLYEGITGERLHDPELFVMVRLAADRAAHDAHVTARLAKIADPRLAELIGDMVRFLPGERPSAADVAARCEALADAMSGPRIKRWAAQLAWPARRGEAGTLSGRIYSEGDPLGPIGGGAPGDPGPTATVGGADPGPTATVDVPAARPGATAGVSGSGLPAALPDVSGPVAPPRRPWLAAAGVGAVAVTAVVVAAIGPGPAVAPPPSPPAPTSPSPTPTPAAPLTPTPAAIPTPAAPTSPSPTPRPGRATPARTDAPAAPPTPTPPVPPAAPAPEPGRFAVVGELRSVQLRGARGTFAPGEVPAGAYRVWALFPKSGDEWRDLELAAEVRPGATVSVRCNPMLWTCELL